MVRIEIEATKKSPKVDLNPENGTAHFSGRSIHSDAFIFYDDIIDWFKRNGDKFEELNVHFGFDHINTVTNKCLLQILLMIKKFSDGGKKVNIVWAYDDEDDDMLETGEELEILSGVKFEYKTI